ncbi:MAG: sugar ABC transporter permease [Clostridia bacterium]|nr:sugar ABC transporter permease [Clostridia bacterium]
MALVPTFALLAVFCYVPFFNAFIKSLYDWNGVNYLEFIGFDNFKELFNKDILWWKSFRRMLVIVVVDVIKATVITTLNAVLLHRVKHARAQYFFRIMIILPAVIPGMVGTLLWRQFVADNGIINEILGSIGLKSMQRQWLGDEKIVLFALLGIIGFPWVNGANTLILLSGLMNIDKSIYDAAELDGVSWWRKLFQLELPLIMPQVTIIIFQTIIGSIQSYENIQVITNGGPGSSTYVPGLLLYNNAFRYNRYGYASAIGVVMFCVIIVFTVINQYVTGRKKNV